VRLPEPLLALRNRVLSKPEFQRWASIFPLTRPRAQRRARELFDIVAGFVYSQILQACVQVRLFEILAEGTQSVDDLAPRLGLPVEGARRLLRAAASLELAEARGDDRYALGELGAAMVGNPGIAAMVEHHAMAYADLKDPVALLRGEFPQRALQGYWAYVGTEAPASAGEQAVSGYSELMAQSQRLIADDVLDAYSLQEHRCLLDVAGGDGTFLVTAAKRWPHLRVILFDLPAVAERARARFQREGLGDRATAIGGDVRAIPCPRGRMSSRWCGCCTIMTTMMRRTSRVRPVRRYPRAGGCWWPNPCRARREPSRSGMPISGSICSLWAAVGRARRVS
jgi:demethylspheroidene O-methyltransferase